jgi:hypothetical protein
MARRLRSPLFAVAALVALGGGFAPAFAAGQYRAELATPQSAQRFVVRDVVWSCDGGNCVAQQTTSRPIIDCSALAGHVGGLRSFAVGGRNLAADELEKCNARGR